MTMNLKLCTYAFAVAVGMGISGGTTQAVAAPFLQDDNHSRDQDYSKNKRYQQGMREGQVDHAHNRDHSKKRHYKKDEEQKSYEAGYQKGRGN
jgi:hypothetical protein